MDNKKLILCVVILLAARSAAAQDLEPAKKQFESRCAGCHGADGDGGEHAPSIVEPRRREDDDGKSPRKIYDTIKNGISEGGMPAFTLPEAEIKALVVLVNAWRAPAGRVILSPVTRLAAKASFSARVDASAVTW